MKPARRPPYLLLEVGEISALTLSADLADEDTAEINPDVAAEGAEGLEDQLNQTATDGWVACARQRPTDVAVDRLR